MRSIRTTLLAGAVGIAALSSAISVSAAAQLSATDRAAVEKALMANEQKVADAIAKGDVKTVQSLIATDAWSADPAGFMSVAEFFKALGSGQVKIAEQKLSDFKYVWADANTVVVGYTWTGKGTFMGQPAPSPVYASTVWNKRGTNWMAVFHQETVAAPPMKK